MNALFALILSPPETPIHEDDTANWTLPIDRAVHAGFAGDRVGAAFAGGYQAALRALVPDLPPGLTALCATEERGVQPSAIRTTLSTATEGGYWLSGKKRWATGAGAAEWLLLVAATGLDDRGRTRLRVACVPANRTGITLEPMPPTPFVPEIGHAQVTLDRVAVAEQELLPGDGWTRYLKPFRTVEDVHVHAALLGYLARIARDWNWPAATRESIAALVVALRALSQEDPSAATLHIALGGTLALIVELIEKTKSYWPLVEAEVRERWQRDAPLLAIAAGARARRLEKAWQLVTHNLAGSPRVELM